MRQCNYTTIYPLQNNDINSLAVEWLQNKNSWSKCLMHTYIIVEDGICLINWKRSKEKITKTATKSVLQWCKVLTCSFQVILIDKTLLGLPRNEHAYHICQLSNFGKRVKYKKMFKKEWHSQISYILYYIQIFAKSGTHGKITLLFTSEGCRSISKLGTVGKYDILISRLWTKISASQGI